MELSAEDYNVLSYLLKHKSIAYEQAIKWVYTQFTDEDVAPFLEALSLALSPAEMVKIISHTHQVYGEPSHEFLAGEIAKQYSEGKLSLHSAISQMLFDLDLALSKEERQALYIAEDYFGWHDAAASQAIEHVMPLFDRYRPVYEHAVAKFMI